MGAVPNAVFERILEAVDANRSADVITVANELLDAGNSPAQLARQCVRYLRNCLIAKIAGIGADGSESDGAATELLQISADEQRRSARSAELFTEEELTRFLQVMLRTFDELGYRQEQRFHFELGLLKLVHLRRLLPVEALLSRFPVPGGRAETESSRPRGTATANVSASSPFVNRAPSATSAPPSPTKAPPAPFTPFEADPSGKFATKAVLSPVPSVAPSAAAGSPTANVKAAASVIEEEPTVEVTPVAVAADLLGMGALPTTAIEPESNLPAAVEEFAKPSAEQLQRVATEALMNAKSQGSAADALADADWKIESGEIQVQTELSKTMLPMVINPEADKIVRAALRSAGASALKLILLPGVANTSAAKKSRPARTGSVQAKAMEHPVVQQAQRLFNAEIRNVIDLRDND
jgi:DNA polymerase-3 subunit gamma/tau